MATLAGAFIACGGSSGASTGSGPDASTPDASAEGGPAVDTANGGDSGCTVPGPGSSCTPEVMPCQPSDRCCAGYEWFCSSASNTWQKAAVGCPPPPNCAESGSSDAQPADAPADTATAAGDSGGDGSASCLGSVTFHIAAGTRATYCGQGPCSTDFVTVLNANGQPLKIRELSSNPCSIIDCSSCRPADSCLCDGGYGPLPAGGLDVTWLGAVWSPSGTCGNSVACEALGCARAGQYTAHVCSLVGPVGASTCNPQTASVCVDVPFTYPAQTTVVVTLP